MAEPLLRLRDLRVSFSSSNGPVEAVRGVSFDIGREKVGIVGESGSGKSMTGRALLRLSPRAATVRAQEMRFDGIDLMTASERRLRAIRGGRISMILQDPKYSLNPLMRVGAQITESCRLHQNVSRTVAREKAIAMLEAVHIREPARVYDLFPHEVSGGMGQRIMIAMMLITEPDLIVADEPTSALDVTVRRQVLSVLEELVTRRGAGLIFISHDLNLVAEFCDRVLVMYAGRVVEELHAAALHEARHPYTQALLRSLPQLEEPASVLAVPTRDPSWHDGPTYRFGELAA
ncbi:MAG: Dipeptide transporter, ATP-binding protein [Roseomonas sp.]|jgi:peptide/nickel transport system ATP-binding protein|nr:Dipeptide transporter, ATP-binding protein [Roseomonas sp.]